MLVLTRKQGEQIRIGDDVVITVVRTKGKGVRLGIQAPTHVPVLRGEIAAAITGKEEQKKSGGEEPDDEAWPGAELVTVINTTAFGKSRPKIHGTRGGRVLLREMVALRGM